MMINANEARKLTIATLKEEQEKACLVVKNVLDSVVNYAITRAATDGEVETSIYPFKIMPVQYLSEIAKKYFLSEIREKLKEKEYIVSYDHAEQILHIRW